MNRTLVATLGALVVLLAVGTLFPQWALFLAIVALAKALVVLGLMLFMRCGLDSFGQGLFYCIGAYCSQLFGVNDIALSLLMGASAAAFTAFVLGFLMSRYRDIFFAMLSLAFSMILYGVLVKSQALGSTDGFHLKPPTLFGHRITGESRYGLYALTCVVAAIAALLVDRYLRTPLGRLGPALKDNEIRVEYMGASARRVIHVNYVIAAALAGVGGCIVGVSVGHIDPEFSYWTQSGEFVFVAILAGTGNVLAPFVGSILFESIRSVATQVSPNTWQMTLGIALLLLIMFLPSGLWSLFTRRKGS